MQKSFLIYCTVIMPPNVPAHGGVSMHYVHCSEESLRDDYERHVLERSDEYRRDSSERLRINAVAGFNAVRFG